MELTLRIGLHRSLAGALDCCCEGGKRLLDIFGGVIRQRRGHLLGRRGPGQQRLCGAGIVTGRNRLPKLLLSGCGRPSLGRRAEGQGRCRSRTGGGGGRTRSRACGGAAGTRIRVTCRGAPGTTGDRTGCHREHGAATGNSRANGGPHLQHCLIFNTASSSTLPHPSARRTVRALLAWVGSAGYLP